MYCVALHYYNSLHYYLQNSQISRLQQFQNSLACDVVNSLIELLFLNL